MTNLPSGGSCRVTRLYHGRSELRTIVATPGLLGYYVAHLEHAHHVVPVQMWVKGLLKIIIVSGA